MSETTTSTPVASELDTYRRRVAEHTFERGVSDEYLTPSEAKEILAEIGIEVSTAQRQRRDGTCSEGTDCPICFETTVTHVVLSPLPEGEGLPGLKRRIFEIVDRLREEKDWCPGGTVAALETIDIEVRADYDDDTVHYDGD